MPAVHLSRPTMRIGIPHYRDYRGDYRPDAGTRSDQVPDRKRYTVEKPPSDLGREGLFCYFSGSRTGSGVQSLRNLYTEYGQRERWVMKITVRAFARFREVVGDVTVLDLPEGSGLSGLLAALASRSDESRDLLFDDKGEIREHVIFMVNRKRVTRSSLEGIILAEGDEVAIYPPVTGG